MDDYTLSFVSDGDGDGAAATLEPSYAPPRTKLAFPTETLLKPGLSQRSPMVRSTRAAEESLAAMAKDGDFAKAEAHRLLDKLTRNYSFLLRAPDIDEAAYRNETAPRRTRERLDEDTRAILHDFVDSLNNEALSTLAGVHETRGNSFGII